MKETLSLCENKYANLGTNQIICFLDGLITSEMSTIVSSATLTPSGINHK